MLKIVLARNSNMKTDKNLKLPIGIGPQSLLSAHPFAVTVSLRGRTLGLLGTKYCTISHIKVKEEESSKTLRKLKIGA